MTTLRDIAKVADVSLATVSRVLNGKQSVAPALASKVLDAAEELGYEKSVRKNEKQTLAVLVTWPSTSPTESQRDNQFSMMFVHSIYITAERLGYHLVFHFGNKDGELSSFLRWQITTRQFEGAIIVGSYLAMEQTYIEHLEAARIPFFRLSKAPAELGRQNYVAVDDYLGGYKAGQHLLSLGIHNILHIAGPKHSRDAVERKKGFLQACHEFGLTKREIAVFQGDFHESAGELCAEQMLDKGKIPGGIFAANDMMAIGCMRKLKKHGIQIPEQLRIVGFDDIMLASYVEPGLTTIKIPFQEIATMATEELVEQIENPVRKLTRVLLDGDLIVRGSCGGSQP